MTTVRHNVLTEISTLHDALDRIEKLYRTTTDETHHLFHADDDDLWSEAEAFAADAKSLYHVIAEELS